MLDTDSTKKISRVCVRIVEAGGDAELVKLAEFISSFKKLRERWNSKKKSVATGHSWSKNDIADGDGQYYNMLTVEQNRRLERFATQ